jgi:hypothetical protein
MSSFLSIDTWKSFHAFWKTPPERQDNSH